MHGVLIVVACGDGPPAILRAMCGRFARRSTQKVLADWFGVKLEDMPWFAPDYNVAPQSTQPVVRLNADTGKREFALMRWGLVPYWAKDAKVGYSTINARAEEAAEKPIFIVKHSKSADASFRRMPFTNGSSSTQKRSGRLRLHCKAGSPTPLRVCGSDGSPGRASRWKRTRS